MKQNLINKKECDMNILSTVKPWDCVAKGYSEVTMKVFQAYSEKALSMVELDENSCILDNACGPGTLALMIAGKIKQVDAVDFSQAMINILNETINDNAINNIKTHCCDAQNLPCEDNCYDAAFSMFGLMFFPDRMKGYQEIYRTLKPGGKSIISSWAPTTDSPMQMAMFGAVRAIKPDLPEPQADIESLENPDFFKEELTLSGFKDVDVLSVESGVKVDSIESFWVDMVKGSAPLAMMKNSMSEEEWQEKTYIALDYLKETLTSLPTNLTAKAWLGVGVK